ncbi:MAG: phage holin family protein [Caldilinea sp.]|jgi:putative membrane protein|nr:phage holin family protein [Caldilinea sp.]
MLRSILIRWIVLAIAVGITTWLLPGIHFDGGFGTLFLVSAVLGFLMAILKPIMILLTCPLVVLTLGLFILVINTLMLYITSWIFPESLQIDTFWWALLASIIISAIAMILNSLLGEE